MAVGYEKKGSTRRVRFLKGVSHDGVDYGPDYPDWECDLSARDAAIYVREGRAEYVGDDTPPPVSNVPQPERTSEPPTSLAGSAATPPGALVAERKARALERSK